MSALLEIRDVSKGFPGVQALQDVDLVLDRGEVLALVGENGAGKSTLMKILSGIYARDTGTISIDGEQVEIAGPRAAQELGISIIHQEMNLLPHLTVAQNIYIGREPRVGPMLQERALRRQTQALLDEIGIRLRPTAVVGDLTVAQQQMVEIAKALSFESTKILVMDEPTSAISISETEVLFRLIASLRERGVGIVYISHRMEELREIADRVTVLRDGRYVDTRDIGEVTDEEIIAMMVGRELSAHHEDRPERQGGDAEVVLSVRGLSTRGLLSDVSFDLHRGEILGFAGLMGAGRTETARAIIGADPISAGTIYVRGEEVRISRPDQAVRRGIGYLPEDRKRHGLMLEQDVAFNVTMSSLAQVRGPLGVLRGGKARQLASSFVDALRIKTPSTRAMVKNLSGGNQQKIVIAKWLARDCDVLIFDEPTRGIDVGAKEEIYRLLHDLAGRGKAVMVISSELPEVLRLAHRIVVMSEGRVTGELANDEADQEKVMALATKNIDEGDVA
ncbi:sugar ABC transporter ATP-binding protein [Serinicoccus kebangsaanensis]|uniref:sugar ABC transporter ATP-binding protein n=1 Tax=Serinicoccus kebangsaanensis TaxID=2602069 RepID=UPI00124DEA5D|nr:sugar ABC transporter ATP-binding protein [Serinicoccus kebangsaanensis]